MNEVDWPQKREQQKKVGQESSGEQALKLDRGRGGQGTDGTARLCG